MFRTVKRWMYQKNRPNLVARILNRGWSWLHTIGIAPNYLVTLEVVGRKSGKVISFPLVMAVVDGERYLVSMLGTEASWVRNVRAADGRAVLRHGKTEHIRLEEVPVQQRAPVIKAYLQRAPGARPHIAVDKDAPIAAFEQAAGGIPVYRVCAGGNKN